MKNVLQASNPLNCPCGDDIIYVMGVIPNFSVVIALQKWFGKSKER